MESIINWIKQLYSETMVPAFTWILRVLLNIGEDSQYQLSDPVVVAGLLATIGVIALTLWLLNAVSLYQIFKKQGVSGWKAFVPLYNHYTLYKLLYGNGWKMLFMLIPFYNIVFWVMSLRRISKLYDKGAGYTVALALMYPFMIVALTYQEHGRKLWEKGKFIIQSSFFILTNSFMVGWFKGNIFQGKLKYICVPGMNCYSCPGAMGACPIGALQAVLNETNYKKSWYDAASGTFVKAPMYWFAFYVIGFIMIVGALCGRLICGLLCPFGWVQDLLHKIPVPKIKLPRDERTIARSKNPGSVRALLAVDKYARYLKYVFLVVMVIVLPLFVKADPWFCKYVCPSGMLIGGIPLISLNEGLAQSVGLLTAFKLTILVLLAALSMFLYRPFCKYVCPLGALYSLMNPFSLYRYGVDDAKCNRSKGCRGCANACRMGVDIVKTPNSPECIRCGDCKNVCPSHAIKSGFKFKTSDGNVIRTGKLKEKQGDAPVTPNTSL